MVRVTIGSILHIVQGTSKSEMCGKVFLTFFVMSAVQNDTLKINHCVNRVAPVSILASANGHCTASQYSAMRGN